MTRSPSRLEREDHPPMSRAIRRVMARQGVSGMDLVRELDGLVSQSTISRYYTNREPDYQMAGHVENVLGVPQGTLMALAGYVPAAYVGDALSAVLVDPSLTERQREILFTGLLSKIRQDAPIHPDALTAVTNDPRLLEADRQLFADMITNYRETNRLLEQPVVKRAPRKHTATR